MTVSSPPGTARPAARVTRSPFRSTALWAAAVPVLVIGQFAMVAIVPVAVVVTRTVRDVRLRALRGWAVALAAAYALPLAMWAIGPERERSLSRDMHPTVAGLLALVAVAYLVALLVAWRRTPARRDGADQPATAA